MQSLPKDFLKESARHLNIADHMTYVTYTLVNEKRLILKIFEEICNSIINSINFSILSEFPDKKPINLENQEIFYYIDHISRIYKIKDKEREIIKQIIEIEQKYKKSAMNFVKKDKIIILSDSLAIHTLNIEKIKQYLLTAKELLMKVSDKTK